MAPSFNLVFCGTPRFAVPTLEKLLASGFPVSLVVTQPDRPRGRGLELAPSPVKARALELGLPVTQPERIKNNPEFQSQISSLKPDAIIVVGYGRMIPQWMLDLPRHRQHQPACVPAAEVSRGRAHPVGDRPWRVGYGSDDHAYRLRAGHGRHSAAKGSPNRSRRHGRNSGAAFSR